MQKQKHLLNSGT